jgi:phosphoenolpyruvate synthase/pyruvate phosphate dikinase
VKKIVPFAKAREASLYGSKAVGLGDAARQGLTVPPGVALSGDLVEAVASGDAKAIEKLANAIAPLAPPFAVRSSAVDEDSAAASFAGQHVTVLNVHSVADVPRAVREVWWSANSDSAITYRLAEQFVKLVLVRLGNQRANFGDSGIDVRGGLSFSGDADTDCPEECVWQFDRRGLGDVKAVDEAVADQIEVAGDSLACFAAKGTQARKHLRGIAVRFEDLAGRGVLAERFLQALHLVGATCGYYRRTAHQSQ